MPRIEEVRNKLKGNDIAWAKRLEDVDKDGTWSTILDVDYLEDKGQFRIKTYNNEYIVLDEPLMSVLLEKGEFSGSAVVSSTITGEVKAIGVSTQVYQIKHKDIMPTLDTLEQKREFFIGKHIVFEPEAPGTSAEVSEISDLVLKSRITEDYLLVTTGGDFDFSEKEIMILADGKAIEESGEYFIQELITVDEGLEDKDIKADELQFGDKEISKYKTEAELIKNNEPVYKFVWTEAEGYKNQEAIHGLDFVNEDEGFEPENIEYIKILKTGQSVQIQGGPHVTRLLLGSFDKPEYEYYVTDNDEIILAGFETEKEAKDYISNHKKGGFLNGALLRTRYQLNHHDIGLDPAGDYNWKEGKKEYKDYKETKSIENIKPTTSLSVGELQKALKIFLGESDWKVWNSAEKNGKPVNWSNEDRVAYLDELQEFLSEEQYEAFINAIKEEIEPLLLNNPDYKYYVLDENNRIITGWEYKEDARDFIKEQQGYKKVRLVSKRDLPVDANDNANWGTNDGEKQELEKRILMWLEEERKALADEDSVAFIAGNSEHNEDIKKETVVTIAMVDAYGNHILRKMKCALDYLMPHTHKALKKEYKKLEMFY